MPDERTWLLVIPSTPAGKAFDRFVFRWTGFSPISFQYAKARRRAYRRQHVLLTTIGSKTGALRTSCLPYFYYEDTLVVCGSKGGGPRDPFWANNIRKEPQCWIRVKGELIPAFGRVAEGEERAKVFDAVAAQHTGLRRYEALAGGHGRHVPLVLLAPRMALPPGA
jgi:deazaflavin-dependent oxidoreductase (nitroreductase family)